MATSITQPPSDAQNNQGLGPIVDEVDIRTMYTEEDYEVETRDGWTLVVTRYKPIKQPWNQPIFGQPLMCVHGFSQNRFAWTAGQFAKNMLYFGADLHFVELRGHGKSSRRLQREKTEDTGRPLPTTFDFDWSLDDYFMYDLPAVIEAVKRVTGRAKVFYCGHSMGGMLGYGLASQRSDIAGLVTIGSPADLGRESILLRVAAAAGSLLPLVGVGIRGLNATRRAQHTALQASAKVLRSVPALGSAAETLLELEPPRNLRPKVVRMDLFLSGLYRAVQATDRTGEWIPKALRIFNPDKHASADLEWVLTEGGEKEPIFVLQQFIRWINHREMKCYANGYDFKANFSRIQIPITIIFGDEDVLAGVRSTRRIYNEVKSDYVVWRPVRGNSHLEITMGIDVRQICYDIKNLMEFGIAHENRSPRLPRFRTESRIR